VREIREWGKIRNGQSRHALLAKDLPADHDLDPIWSRTEYDMPIANHSYMEPAILPGYEDLSGRKQYLPQPAGRRIVGRDAVCGSYRRRPFRKYPKMRMA